MTVPEQQRKRLSILCSEKGLVLVLQFKTLETSQNESKCHHASNITHYPALAQHVKERKRERNALKTHGAETLATIFDDFHKNVMAPGICFMNI